MISVAHWNVAKKKADWWPEVWLIWFESLDIPSHTKLQAVDWSCVHASDCMHGFMWWPLHDDSLVSAGNPLGDRPPRSPGVDPKQLAAELQKVSQQQAPTSASTSGLPATASTTSSPGQPGSPSVSKKRHSSKVSSRGVVSQVQFTIKFSLSFV